MPLPYPSMDFTAFDVLPASELDKIVANIEALAAGTGLTATNWSNPYKFAAYSSAGGTLLAAQSTQVAFNTEEFDTNGNFASNAYTVPATGFYRVHAAIEVTSGSSNEDYIIQLYKNGAEFKRGQRLRTGGGGQHLLIISTPPLSLTAGNILTIWGFNGSGGNKSISGGQAVTYFGVEWVSKT